MNTKKSIKKNYIYSMLYQILTVLTPLITMPYVSRVLKADGIGRYSFSSSVMNYFALFASMGIASYGRREVSYYQNDRIKRSAVYWNLKSLSAINVTVCASIYLVLAAIYSGENFVIYLILTMPIVNVVFDNIWFFQGVEEFGVVVAKNTIVRFCGIIFTFTFVKTKADLPVYIFGTVFFDFAGNILLWLYMPHYVDKPVLKSITPFHDIKLIWALFLPAIAVEVYTVLDKTMIGLLTEGTFENGYYEQALKVTRITLSVITVMASVVGARIGYLFFNGRDQKQIEYYMYNSYKFVWCLGIPMCLGLISVSGNFVPWFFGRGFEKVAMLINISSFLILAVGISSTTAGQYLIPTKRHNIFTRAVMAGAAVNFTLNVFLIRMFKSYGAITASVVAETVIAVIEVFAVRKELSFRKIIACGKNYYLSGLSMFGILAYLFRKSIPSPANTFTMIFTGAAVYFLGLVILRDEFFIDNARKVVVSLAKRLHIKV